MIILHIHADDLCAFCLLACCFSLAVVTQKTKKRQMEFQKATESSPTLQAEQRPGTIVALGDSLTAGLGVDEHGAYPARRRRLQAEGHNFRVINAGVSGETAAAPFLA